MLHVPHPALKSLNLACFFHLTQPLSICIIATFTETTVSVKNLIDALLSPNVYDHPVKYFEVIETHISHVILTGEFAYKIKKPVKFDFLDYTSLDARRVYSEKELAFNSRLASDVYLEVVTINQLPNGKLKINGEGPVIEYALKMREFHQSQLFESLIQNARVHEEHFDLIAERIARFYQHIESATPEMPYATPEIVMQYALANFHEARPFLKNIADLEQLAMLERTTAAQGKQLHPFFLQRKEQGCIKACHGDLHLGNIALLKDTPVIFDCIEFNEYMRWTDTMADVGFLMMDLYFRGKTHFANYFLNSYLTHYGDFTGLQMLPFYIAYRAMVRAKIQLFETANDKGRSEEELLTNYRRYAKIAEQFLHRNKPTLVLMHGVSGSGKSTLARVLAPQMDAVHIRADVERKRLFGLKPTDRVTATQKQTLYSAEATSQTYDQLATIATSALQAGFSVIVDATFLQKAHREKFFALAQHLAAPFVIVSCAISKENAAAAVSERLKANTDASDATVEVLEWLLEQQELLTEIEQDFTVQVNRDHTPDVTLVYHNINQAVNKQAQVLLDVR